MRSLSQSGWVSHLEANLVIAREGKDPEGIHQVRVAGRRLRVWLDLGGHRALTDDVRWLVRAVGALRDFDVMSTTPLAGRGPFAQWLVAQAEAQRRLAAQVLDSPRARGLPRAFRSLPPIEVGQAARALPKFERAFAECVAAWAGLGTAALPVRFAALHASRRTLRRLRYAREWLGLKAPGLVALQDVLGTVCDVAALDALLRQWARDAGARASAAQPLAVPLKAMLDELTAASPRLRRLC